MAPLPCVLIAFRESKKSSQIPIAVLSTQIHLITPWKSSGLSQKLNSYHVVAVWINPWHSKNSLLSQLSQRSLSIYWFITMNSVKTLLTWTKSTRVGLVGLILDIYAPCHTTAPILTLHTGVGVAATGHSTPPGPSASCLNTTRAP